MVPRNYLPHPTQPYTPQKKFNSGPEENQDIERHGPGGADNSSLTDAIEGLELPPFLETCDMCTDDLFIYNLFKCECLLTVLYMPQGVLTVWVKTRFVLAFHLLFHPYETKHAVTV